MSETMKAIRSMAVWCGILILCVVGCVIEMYLFRYPKGIFELFYFPCLAFLLFCYFYMRIAENSRLKRCLMAVAGFILMLAVIKLIRYESIGANETLNRFLWYTYYIPMLMIPLFSFYGTRLIHVKDLSGLRPSNMVIGIVTGFFVLSVLTNDVHQMIFRFQEVYNDSQGSYSYGWLYWVITAWQYGLYLASLITMIQKCRISGARKAAWVPVVPFVVGGYCLILIFLGYDLRIGTLNVMNMPEVCCIMAAMYWECCICIGLIPSNRNYSKLMEGISIPIWICDEDHNVIYRSGAASDLSVREMACADRETEESERILHRRRIPGGYGIWQEDISELKQINRRLEDLQERLREEVVLTRLENCRKEEAERINRKNAVYDQIAARTRGQAKRICQLANEAAGSKDPMERQRKTDWICFYGAYIKRSANLLLLAEDLTELSTGELGLSVAESLRYLKKTGVSCRFGSNTDRLISAEKVIGAYELFEQILEETGEQITALYATFSTDGTMLRINLEGFDGILSSACEKLAEQNGIGLNTCREDDTFYIRIELGEEVDADVTS